MKKWWWGLALILLVLPTVYAMLRPGFFPMQDDLQAFRIHQMDKCIADGQIPCRWVPDAGYQYGYPQFNYYSPFTYYLGEAFHLIGFQFIDAVKILFVLGYVVGTVGMFVLVSTLVGNWPGFVAAALFTYAPYKAVEVYVRGAMSEFWAISLFPLVFWAGYRLVRDGGKKYFLWFSISIALLTTSHNLMPIIFLPVVGLWILYWMYEEKKWIRLKDVVLSGLLGLGLASFFILPLAFEREFVNVWSVLSGYFDYRRHFVDLSQLFFDTSWGYGSSEFVIPDGINLSTGIIHWVVGALAGVLALLNRKKNKKFFRVVLGLLAVEMGVLFMMHVRSSFVWQIFGVLKWLQFPWRFMGLSVFLLSLLGGYAVKLSGYGRRVFGTVVILISMILYAGYFQPLSWIDLDDTEKFSGVLWEKQLTISIFDYTPIYAELPPPSKAPDLPEVMDGKAEFLEYTKGSDWQKGTIKVDEVAVIRLPLFDFPGMRVRVDGDRVDHWNDDCREQKHCLGLITFRVPEGEHEVMAELTNTPVRTIGNTITIASFLVLGKVYVDYRKNKKKTV